MHLFTTLRPCLLQLIADGALTPTCPLHRPVALSPTTHQTLPVPSAAPHCPLRPQATLHWCPNALSAPADLALALEQTWQGTLPFSTDPTHSPPRPAHPSSANHLDFRRQKQIAEIPEPSLGYPMPLRTARTMRQSGRPWLACRRNRRTAMWRKKRRRGEVGLERRWVVGFGRSRP